jgi:ATP-dependent RNA/DNA helicase IGHMBP2
VALTRARKKLVVIGDSATLSNHKFYKEFLDYIESIDAYKSAWEFIQA